MSINGKPAKGGAISAEDRKFILENMSRMTVEQMAEQLNRNPLVVQKVIQTYTNLPDIANQAIRWRLKKSNHWKQLKSAFNEIELSHIEDEYVTIVQQFKEDIVATEEVQILDFIKTGILQQRNLESKQKIQNQLNEYARLSQGIEDAVGGDFSLLTTEQHNSIMEYSNKKTACMQAESNRTTEWLALQKEKNVLYEKIMGSRDQRIKEIMNTKVSFTSFIKQLLEKDKQEKESRFIQLYSKASDKEFSRLMQPYVYADGNTDNPILSAEVIEEFEKKNDEEEQLNNLKEGKNGQEN